MCGVVSIVYEKNNKNLGNEACFLLKKLEYRGFDSTGASFMTEGGSVVLKKKVGAPSVVTEELEIAKRQGKKFIGQVRWATYGSVTDENAQPHEVKCRAHIIGAYTGNISNRENIKEFILDNGHEVLTDNDGEMLVHLIEHYYTNLLNNKTELQLEKKIEYFKQAIRKAQQKAYGAYSACVSAPDIPGVFAIKSGSSLYAGKGEDENGEFILVSSDLTSVLAKTRILIPVEKGEAIYFTHNDYLVFSSRDEREYKPNLKRSHLSITEVSLQPRFNYFMEQEIHSSPANLDILMKYYLLYEHEKQYQTIFEYNYKKCRALLYELAKLYNIFDNSELKDAFLNIINNKDFKEVFNSIVLLDIKEISNAESTGFSSEDAPLLNELLGFGEEYFMSLFILDLMVVWKKKRTIVKYKLQTISLLKNTKKDGHNIYLVATGSSYHSSLVAAHFFSNINGISTIPSNPGMFRSIYLGALKRNDIIIGVSQSGETEDLVNLFADIKNSYNDEVKLLSIINHENSILPQEFSEFFLPTLCSTEIAAIATKSFISQIALFYLLSLTLEFPDDIIRKKFDQIKHFMELTLKNIEQELSEVTLRLFFKSSMHFLSTSLIGIAKEGALKVREVVLNHAEGYDSEEFKHGASTILGKNTIFSFNDLEALHAKMLNFYRTNSDQSFKNKEQFNSFLLILESFNFSNNFSNVLNVNSVNKDDEKTFRKAYVNYRDNVNIEDYFSNYPLVFICPPNDKDKQITINQINANKIRGANIYLIAEEDEELRKTIEENPNGIDNYYYKYIVMPKTDDRCTFTFTSVLTLQILALQMSITKRKYLNKCKIENHGVHPDVPKNITKSIPVD